MGFFSEIGDAFGGVVDSVGSAIKTVGGAAQDVNGWLGDTVVGSVDSIGRNLDDYWKAGIDLTRNGASLGTDILTSGVQDPFDINSWSDPAQQHLDDFNGTGDELFGTGGWIKAGTNMFTAGNPFYGAGSVGYQIDSGLNGTEYNNGKTGGISNLVGLYNMGSNVTNAMSSTPSTTTSLSGTDSMDNTSLTNQDYGDYGYTQAPTASFGDATSMGQVTPSLSGFDLSTQAGELGNGVFSTVGKTYLDPETLMGQLSSTYNTVANYVNSPLGKFGLQVGATMNPKLAALASLGAAGGDTGSLSQAGTALASLYKGWQTENQLKQTKRALDAQLNSGLATYAPDSAYGQMLRQTLERQDAAAGRGSQYGQREVELAAKLADKQNSLRQTYMSQAPTLAGMNSGVASAKNAGVADLFSLYAKNANQINPQVQRLAQNLQDYLYGNGE